MHEKCVEFVVEYCRNVCLEWASCISTAKGFDKGNKEDITNLLFCLKGVENPGKTEEEIEQEIATLNL